MTLEELQEIAKQKLGPDMLPGFTLEVQPASEEGQFQVRITSQVYDYQGYTRAHSTDRLDNTADQLDAMREQTIENILLGYAKHLEGYPKEFGE